MTKCLHGIAPGRGNKSPLEVSLAARTDHAKTIGAAAIFVKAASGEGATVLTHCDFARRELKELACGQLDGSGNDSFSIIRGLLSERAVW